MECLRSEEAKTAKVDKSPEVDDLVEALETTHETNNKDESLITDSFDISPETANLSISEEPFSLFKRRKNVLIRPTVVPRAPENSTQFIIDDHESSHLYCSFETPYRDNETGEDGHIDETLKRYTCRYDEDAAFQDIDYEYELPQDLDVTAFYTRDFEMAYNVARFEELIQLSREELIEMYKKMELRVREIQKELKICDPLADLQKELLHLQEQNESLKQHNNELESIVTTYSDDYSSSSSEENSQDENLPEENNACK